MINKAVEWNKQYDVLHRTGEKGTLSEALAEAVYMNRHKILEYTNKEFELQNDYIFTK